MDGGDVEGLSDEIGIDVVVSGEEEEEFLFAGADDDGFGEFESWGVGMGGGVLSVGVAFVPEDFVGDLGLLKEVEHREGDGAGGFRSECEGGVHGKVLVQEEGRATQHTAEDQRGAVCGRAARGASGSWREWGCGKRGIGGRRIPDEGGGVGHRGKAEGRVGGLCMTEGGGD